MDISYLIEGVLISAVGRISRWFNHPLCPRAVNYVLTYRCNLRCQMCDVHRNTELMNRYKDELSACEVGKIFQDACLRNIDIIRITGGEPFLRNDIADVLLGIAQNSNPKTFYISSNGLFPEKIVESLKDVLSKRINIHIQIGVNGIGSVHDKISGIRGSFDKVYQTLEGLKKLQEKYLFYVGINHTLVQENLKYQEDVENLAENFGFGYKPMLASLYCENTFIDINSIEEEVPYKLAFKANRDELNNIYKKFKKLTYNSTRSVYSKKVTTSFLWKIAEKYLYEGEMNRLFLGKSHPRPPCMALFVYFRLLPNGDVVACTPLLESIGNLKEDTFSNLWKSRNASYLRKKVKRCKGCWIACDIGPSIFYSCDIVLWMINKQFRKFIHKLKKGRD